MTNKNQMVFGVGVNDANYTTQPWVHGKQVSCPFYRCWKNMLNRCYSANIRSNNPTYIDCTVCKEWLSFMTFRDWMKSQDWEDKHLDKDLIGNEKLYSPENCVFISRELNMLFNDREAARGEHPLGVTKANGAKKFKAKIGGDRKRKHLGYFTNTYDAHEAWYNAKLKIVNELLAKETNPRIRYAIACKIAKLEANFLCGISRYRGSRVTKGPDYQPPEENIRNILLGEIEKEPR